MLAVVNDLIISTVLSSLLVLYLPSSLVILARLLLLFEQQLFKSVLMEEVMSNFQFAISSITKHQYLVENLNVVLFPMVLVFDASWNLHGL